MPRAFLYDVVLNTSGSPVSGASVQVNNHGGGAASLFTSEAGGVTAANPIVTGSDGVFSCWIAEGTYDLVISGSGLTTATIYRDVLRASNEPGPTLTTTGDIPYASAANTLARLAIGSDGKWLRVTGGIPVWTTPAWVSADIAAGAAILGSQLATGMNGPPGTQLVKDTISANTGSITATTEGTSVAVITGSAFTYDGASEVKVEFWAGGVSIGAATVAVSFVMYRDSTVLGQALYAATVTGAANWAPYVVLHDTPSSGSHTYTLKAFVNTSSLIVLAGSGGSGALPKAFLKVTKV